MFFFGLVSFLHSQKKAIIAIMKIDSCEDEISFWHHEPFFGWVMLVWGRVLLSPHNHGSVENCCNYYCRYTNFSHTTMIIGEAGYSLGVSIIPWNLWSLVLWESTYPTSKGNHQKCRMVSYPTVIFDQKQQISDFLLLF